MNQNKEHTKSYDRITCYFRQKLEEKVFHTVKEKCLVKNSNNEEGYFLYHVKLQNLDFYCDYSDDELQHMISTCTDILEVLKQRANAGETKESLADIKKRIEERNQDLSPEHRDHLNGIGYAREVSSDECETLIYLLGVYTRVGGAYAMLLAYPRMRQANAIIFETFIDRFDDTGVYYTSLYFLTRAAMGMHEVEIPDPDSSAQNSISDCGSI